jgi:acyl-CoA thioester hydrolase
MPAGVVYYANYLKFFERCRTEWMRSAGHDQRQLALDAGIGFVARKANCEYLRPAHLDDLLTVGLEVEKLTRARHLPPARPPRRRRTGHRHRRNRLRRHGDHETRPIPDFLYSKLEALK